MSSQTPTSYSTLCTLGGLSGLLVTVCRGAYCIKPILKHSGHAKNDYHLWYTHVGGVVPKCVICDGDSIIWVQFFGKKISPYIVSWDLENFHIQLAKRTKAQI